MRGLECELALLNKADGSASFQQGDTKVLCAVYGPTEVKANREIIEKATLDCILKPKNLEDLKVGVPIYCVKEKALEDIISKTCEEITLTTLHPRSAMQVVFQIMQDSGSLVAVLINSACMAMVHAGLPMKCMVVAISCALSNEGEDDEIIMDPTELQEQSANCVMTFAFDSSTMEMITSYTKSCFTVNQFFKCMEHCKEAAKEIVEFQRESISRFLSKDANAADSVTEEEEESDDENDNEDEEME